jgi:small-conductance mechanosensitive channel
MPIISDWGVQLSNAFTGIGVQVLQFLPMLILAIIIFIAGWVVGSVLADVVSKIVKAIKIDSILESAGARGLLSKAGFNLNAGAFLGGLVKWFIIIVFLVAALDVLNLEAVNMFLTNVVLQYIPQVIVATLILVVAAVIADLSQKILSGGARALESKHAGLVGGIARWSIWIVAILAALNQLGIAGGMMQTLFTGLVAMLALAGGLAFGLGGKDAASRYIEKLREDISNR